MKGYVGIDLGGTSVKAMLYTENNEWSSPIDISTKDKNADEVISDIKTIIETLVSDKGIQLQAVGLGFPGVVTSTGLVKVSPNLNGWTEYPLGEKLSKETGVKVVIANDANTAAMGEANFSGNTQYNNMLLLTLGTGIGTGIVVNGSLVAGYQGFGGEGGHIVVKPDGIRCNCGKHGCLETCFSATAVIREGVKSLKTNSDSLIARMVDGEASKITAKTVVDAAREGDQTALDILYTGAEYFALGVTNITTVIDPEVIVIAGGMTQAGDFLLNILKEKIENQMTLSGYEKPEIKFSTLQHTAGIKGAVALAIQSST